VGPSRADVLRRSQGDRPAAHAAVIGRGRPLVHASRVSALAGHIHGVDLDVDDRAPDHDPIPKTREEGCPPSRRGEVMPHDKSAR